MNKPMLVFAGLYGFLGVAMGAFGAHALKSRLAEDLLVIFETGSRYCLIHAVALMCVSILAVDSSNKAINRSGWFFVVGITIFSGTLWLLALTGVRWLGAITPFGGVCLILGWFFLIVAGIQRGEV
jgi:uncharacterized membrane protein YgdD (TMEM256/DUF423 family)